ncbi:MAG: four helix bundle protein [Patescibacteria group bacterium]
MEEKKYLALRNVDAYKKSLLLSNEIWAMLKHWDYFSRDTVGKQYARAADSISANIAEGFGRYHKKDKVLFYRYAYGSLHESVDWTVKSRMRGLIDQETYERILKSLQNLMPSLHHLIKFTNEKLQH